jgi:hypothetical protein
MADCYPQGCPPCTEEISFPENPINGQRECFHIGKDPNTGEDILKCWVYDQCVPGWRAEGPATAPLQFKGGVDLTKTEAENNITVKEAGDYYIVNNGSADILDVNGNVIKTAQQFLDDEWADLQHPILEGAFILWSGSEWVEIPRPCGEDAVQSDWLQTEEDAPDFIKNKPEIPDAVGNIGDGGSVTITINELAPAYCSGSNLTVSADLETVDADGNQVVGIFEYTWQGSNDGTNWTNRALIRSHAGTFSNHTEHTIENYTGDPAQLRLQVEFTDFYGNELIVVSDPIIPTAGSTASITTQPVALDLSTNSTGSFTVTDDAPATNKEYRWFINGSLITAATTPDLGYTFADWTTATLGVTRDDAAAGSYPVHVEIQNTSNCAPVLISDTVVLTGPEADPVVPPPPIPELGAIGSYDAITYSASGALAPHQFPPEYYPGQIITRNGNEQWRVINKTANWKQTNQRYSEVILGYLIQRIA